MRTFQFYLTSINKTKFQMMVSFFPAYGHSSYYNIKTWLTICIPAPVDGYTSISVTNM